MEFLWPLLMIIALFVFGAFMAKRLQSRKRKRKRA